MKTKMIVTLTNGETFTLYFDNWLDTMKTAGRVKRAWVYDRQQWPFSPKIYSY